MALVKCEMCGSMVSDTARECPNCGCALTPATVSQHVKTPQAGGSEPSAEYMEKFNWGAFWFCPLWCIFNGMWWGALIYWVLCLTGLGSIIAFVGSILLGKKGNELAWKYKQWTSVEDFYKTQAEWVKWAWYLLYIVLGIVVLGIILAIVGTLF